MEDDYRWCYELRYQYHKLKATLCVKLSDVFLEVASFFSNATDKHIKYMKEYAAMLERSFKEGDD